MPFTVQQLADAAKVALDYHLKNNPVDQIEIDRPFLKAMQSRKAEFPGAKEYVVEQLRYRYQSNFQWYRGSGQVSYNERQTIEQCKFPWRSAHDGVMIDEDRLNQNGIVTTEDRQASASQAEVIQLTNLLTETNETLRLGFEEKFSAAIQLDGTSSADAIAGLDSLVSIADAPTAASQRVVGGIDVFTNPWFDNNRKTGLASGTILGGMEEMWRACVRTGGRPTNIFVGKDFIDAFATAAVSATGGLQRFLTVPQTGGTKLDPGVTGYAFKGVELTWVPEWDDDFDGMVAPSTTWAKRAYMLNLRRLRLRPLQGQDMVSRKPPRPYDRYVIYQALTWKGAMTMNMGKAHAGLALT